jgi:DNA anti-recombination protein RmuC
MNKVSERSKGAEKDPKIEAIKEIIFGENIKEIEKDFDETRTLIKQQKENLNAYIEQTRKELENSIEQMKEDFDRQMKVLKEDMTQKFDQLHESSANRHRLGKMLEDLGKNLQA